MDFGLVLGANLASKTAQDAKKASPRRLKKMKEKEKKTSNERSVLRQQRAGGTPWARAEICGFLEVLASILGSFLMIFRASLTSYWAHGKNIV